MSSNENAIHNVENTEKKLEDGMVPDGLHSSPGQNQMTFSNNEESSDKQIAKNNAGKRIIDYNQNDTKHDTTSYNENSTSVTNTAQPKTICNNRKCMQPNPPGAIRLEGESHRGLALLLHDWKGCNTTQQCNLAYVMIPKSGSTATKNAIKFTSGKIEKVWLSSADGTALTNYNPFIFTVIRHPGERIASAYSTIMSRYGGRFSHNKNFSPTPDNTTDIAAWSLHFSESIRLMMNTVKQIGWNTTLLFWNVHIVPQVEFMRGLNISHIGCLHSINETLKQMHLGPLQNFKTNIYEHTDNMPTEKFASYDLVDEETKTLMKELYAEDYKLYEETCVDSNTK